MDPGYQYTATPFNYYPGEYNTPYEYGIYYNGKDGRVYDNETRAQYVQGCNCLGYEEYQPCFSDPQRMCDNRAYPGCNMTQNSEMRQSLRNVPLNLPKIEPVDYYNLKANICSDVDDSMNTGMSYHTHSSLHTHNTIPQTTVGPVAPAPNLGPAQAPQPSQPSQASNVQGPLVPVPLPTSPPTFGDGGKEKFSNMKEDFSQKNNNKIIFIALVLIGFLIVCNMFNGNNGNNGMVRYVMAPSKDPFARVPRRVVHLEGV